jgi:hypothetical protein
MGKTKSCGCLARELISGNQYRVTHGDSKNGKMTRLYAVWQGMRNRCKNKRDVKNWRLYGGRGIRVCPEWEHYEAFKKWAMENDYRRGLSLDRVNNNGNYEPLNCRWTTRAEQMLNRRPYGLIETFSDEMLISEVKKRNLKIA